ncbi:MAG: methyltransferase domain-containing protein [Proteobacteria bacterium]|nr:methyltransferase domain-containing protein [Pseudomonadota bacterium]
MPQGVVPEAAAAAPAQAAPNPLARLLGKVRAQWDAQAHRRACLRAWWQGVAPPPPPAAPAEPAQAAEIEIPAPQKVTNTVPDKWSGARIKVAELIWSDGFSFPGGAEHVLKMVKPFGLTKEKSFLDLGCGLGGATRAINKTLGVWALGMEASQGLATAGMGKSEMAGLAKKAPIQWFDPAAVELPQRKYDAIFARHLFCALADKKRLLMQMEKALKAGGQMMFIDFVLRQQGVRSPAIDAWMTAEDQTQRPGVIEDFQRDLKELKMDVRIAEDMSAEFKGIVLQGWQNLTTALKPGALSAEDSRLLVHEIELWTKRVAALDSGDLRMVRILALKRN